jgi:hypothetical protein
VLKFDNTCNQYQTVFISPIPVYVGLVKTALVFPKKYRKEVSIEIVLNNATIH